MNALVTAARTLLGKPFRHRGRGPTYFDCVGLGLETYRLCGVDLKDFTLYGKEPHNDGLIQRVVEAMGEPVAVAPIRESDLQVGDVVVMRLSVEPHHVALVTDYPFGGFALLHACGHNKRVIEHRMAPDQLKRITHVFRRPV